MKLMYQGPAPLESTVRIKRRADGMERYLMD